MMIDPFYPILPDANWVARIVPLGVRMVQLRVKNMSESQIRAQIIASQAVCNAHGCLLVVNDHWQLALAAHCDAVHLGQEDLEYADMVAIRAAGLSVGISTHDERELQLALDAKPDYIALGPVFGTSSKKVPWQAQGLERVTQWRERVPDLPLIAIGGITAESAMSVLNAGAASVAVIGDVTNATDPESQVKRWLEITHPLRA